MYGTVGERLHETACAVQSSLQISAMGSAGAACSAGVWRVILRHVVPSSRVSMAAEQHSEPGPWLITPEYSSHLVLCGAAPVYGHQRGGAHLQACVGTLSSTHVRHRRPLQAGGPGGSNRIEPGNQAPTHPGTRIPTGIKPGTARHPFLLHAETLRRRRSLLPSRLPD